MVSHLRDGEDGGKRSEEEYDRKCDGDNHESLNSSAVVLDVAASSACSSRDRMMPERLHDAAPDRQGLPAMPRVDLPCSARAPAMDEMG